jgi:peroxiredoxin
MNLRNIWLALIIVFICTASFAQDKFTLVKTGEPAPDFEYNKPDGVVRKLSELKGKVVLINFFATWCPPCRQELPHLQSDIYLKYKDRKDFELLIFGREQTAATIDSFKVANKYQMAFYPDLGRKIFSLYGTQNIPRNFLIDKSGKIVFTSVGYNEKDFEKLKKEIKDLLK